MDYSVFARRPKYQASTCTLRKGKYYVSVTVPKQIEPLFKAKQIRRSTGTSDFTIARQRQHALAEEIYRYMDGVWEAAFRKWEENSEEERKGHASRFAEQIGLPEGFDTNRHKKYLEDEMHSVLRDHFAKGTKPLDYEITTALHLLTATPRPPIDKAKSKPEGDTIENVLPAYLDGRNWTRLKSRDAAKRQIERFIVRRQGF